MSNIDPSFSDVNPSQKSKRGFAGGLAELEVSLLGVALFLVALMCSSCGPEATPKTPVIVIAIDGADGLVVRDLWSQNRLPALRAIAERGLMSDLGTLVPSRSPVVWTTVATGMRPKDHGITDFVIPTESGDVPVSTDARKVPAVWNMVSAAGLKVAVLGWWPTWPAEDVHGVVISNRIFHHKLDDRFSPPSFASDVERLMAQGRAETSRFPANVQAETDQLLFVAARELAAQDFDVVLVYFRSVDVTSHGYWKYFRPESFTDPKAVPKSETAKEEDVRLGEVIPRAYEAVDHAIAEILTAAGPDANVFVVSDHGFVAQEKEKIRINFDLDRVLSHFGYLHYNSSGVDTASSKLMTHATPNFALTKMVRFLGDPDMAERTRLRSEFEEDLATVEYESGQAALLIRDAKPHEEKAGADFIVEVSEQEPTRGVVAGGELLEAVVTDLVSVSGGHPGHQPGIFLAAGPDIDSEVEFSAVAGGPRVYDITPTLLYALDLPIAKDFAGRVLSEIFTEEFRQRHPAKSIASWGSGGASEVRRSEVDEEMVDELRTLGYID